MKEQQEWSRLAWHGIAFDVPDDWCPGSVEGDYANGYLRVEDEASVRLELRWETPRRGAPSASDLVDSYLKQTRKKLPRGAPEPRVDRGRAIRELAGLDHEAFTWRGGFRAHSVLLVAPGAARVVHARVFFEEGNEEKALARRIFGSLRVGPHDGLEEWSVFGLSFRMPQEWRLEHSSLRTGCLQLVFQAGGDQLEVARQSLAEFTLRKAALAQWLEGFFAKAWSTYRLSSEPAEYRGHPAARCTGVQSLRARPLAALRRRRHATALAWHCPQADKLFALRCDSTTPDDPRVAACAATIVCH
ncbi:MAG TPA: hypothetical protein PLE19_09640 [Planctomycetota bacterium]|nr:hypothetical protein [Planctomycetota bacterium]HRR82105.1 hypothetical protein [Planctomycetota bacterium]HRT96701.1 hypothetical protein [Planctomycetota bacterium]